MPYNEEGKNVVHMGQKQRELGSSTNRTEKNPAQLIFVI